MWRSVDNQVVWMEVVVMDTVAYLCIILLPIFPLISRTTSWVLESLRT